MTPTPTPPSSSAGHAGRASVTARALGAAGSFAAGVLVGSTAVSLVLGPDAAPVIVVAQSVGLAGVAAVAVVATLLERLGVEL